jgi:hypothetical protein
MSNVPPFLSAARQDVQRLIEQFEQCPHAPQLPATAGASSGSGTADGTSNNNTQAALFERIVSHLKSVRFAINTAIDPSYKKPRNRKPKPNQKQKQPSAAVLHSAAASDSTLHRPAAFAPDPSAVGSSLAAVCPAPSRAAASAPIPAPATSSAPPPGSARISARSPIRVVCLDVECVASGKGHSDRAPCWVAMLEVPATGAEPSVLLDLKMRPPTIFDYMEEMSGVNEATLRDAVPMDTGIQQVRAAQTRDDPMLRCAQKKNERCSHFSTHFVGLGIVLFSSTFRFNSILGPNVVLVGWNVQNDIDWLWLQKGVHYREAVDIIDWFSHPETNFKTGKP